MIYKNSIILRICFAGAFYLSGLSAASQDLIIKRIEMENDNVFLFYDLTDTTRERFYTINLYSSHDDFINPLQKTKGDIGLEVIPGSNRKIELSVKEEFGPTFSGKVSFELRAVIYVPFIRIENFNDYKKFKRGTAYEIHWTGGRPQNILNFELYRGDRKVLTFSNIANRGKYVLIFPPDTRPGTNYHFKISDPTINDEIVNTKEFAIIPKIPLVWKILPPILLGGVLIILLKPKGDSTSSLPDFPGNPN